ncbi:hypothetical protein [Streptomyces sp. MJM1172]|uniref:hypothetical protein n=1 Tax=Streptomyces sp. MJM1172 TaxID=1703926 RepID=UPI00096006EA|nr:hypothetical protein [Streptomyces sp. MJM1172]OKI65628.1 hypothetical protein AMK15_09465 [Streptomyces sp. MJM1172]
MRPSARIPGILAGLVLATGGIVFAAPAATAAAPTSVQDCEKYVAQHSGKKGTAGVGQACYEGSIGNQTSCAASLTAVGISANVASGACRAAH